MKDELKPKEQLLDELRALRKTLEGIARVPSPAEPRGPLPKPLEDFRKFSTRLLLASINALPQLVHVVDADLRIKLVNEAFLKRAVSYGLSADLLEKHVREAFPFLTDQVLDEYRAVIQTRQAISTCEKNMISDRVVYTETAKIPIVDVDRVTHVVTVIADMTDYVQRELELRRDRDLLDRVMETGPAGILVVDREGKIIFANPPAERILRLEKSDQPGTHYANAGWFVSSFESDDVARLINPLREAARTGAPLVDLSHRVQWPDGRSAALSVNAAPLLDHQGHSGALVVTVEDVTDHVLVSEELRRSKDVFDRLLQVIPDMISVHDRDYRILYSNWRGFADVPAEKRKLGAKCHQIYRGLPQVCPDCRVGEVFASKQAWRGQIKIPEGRWMDLTILPLFDARGEVEMVVEWMRDITAMRTAEEARRKTEERYRLLAENSIDVIWLMELDGRLAYLSPSVEAMTGYSPKELVGLTIDRLLTTDSAAKILDYIKRELPAADSRCRQLLSGEFQQLHKTGVLVDIEITATWVFDQYGLPTALQGISRDITDRKRAQQAYRSLAENSLQGMAIFQEGRIVFANRAFAAITKRTATELLETPSERIMAAIHPDDRETVQRNLLDRLAGRKVPNDYSFRFIRHDGATRWVDVFSTLIEYNNRPAVQVLFIDTTARKEAEREKGLLEEQLRQSQKMEAIGRLAGGVAHDFNNLLTAIGGFASVVKNSLDGHDPLAADVQEIINAAESAGKLTQQLLAFSRKQPVSPRVINLNEVIARCEKMLQRIIGEDIIMILQPAADLWSTCIDPGQIEQVLVNIAVNARDAMPDVGRLSISTANVVVENEPCLLSTGSFSGEFVLLTVSDTGYGIDPQILTQIFEPFFTTKERGKGTGLGLSTVFGIVRQNDGYIRVESTPGQGAAFKIYLPRCLTEPEVAAEPLPENRLSGAETILLVEDEPMVRKLARRILQIKGYRVLEASDGGGAMLLAEKHRGEIDLLLTDVVMPNMNGKELHRRLLAEQPQLRVLYMSGYTEDSIVHHGVLEPGTHFIQKPFHPLDLARAVRETIEAEARSTGRIK